MTNEIENAYTAGIIDGEGSILLTKKHSTSKFRHPVVSVSSTTLALLEFLKEKYGGHISNHKTYQDHHKQSWSWKIAYSDCLNLLNDILPYLREPDKIRRSKLLVEVYPTLTKRNGKYSQEEVEAKLQFEADFTAS